MEGGEERNPAAPASAWPPFSTPNLTLWDHQPSPKPALAPTTPDKAATGSIPCRKPRWSREPPPSAPPCWNRKGRWEEILETFQPEGRRGEGRKGGGGGAGENRAGTGIPRPTPLESHSATPTLPLGSLHSLHHWSWAPPAAANAPFASRHNRQTFAYPPLRPRPPVPTASRPKPVGTSSRPGLNCLEAVCPTHRLSAALGHSASELLASAGSPGLHSLPREEQVWGLQLPTGTTFGRERELKNVHIVSPKFFHLAVFYLNRWPSLHSNSQSHASSHSSLEPSPHLLTFQLIKVRLKY